MKHRCVNCGLNTLTVSVSDLEFELQGLLRQWIPSTFEIFPEYHNICRECCNVLRGSYENENQERKYGHKSVCLGCGKSLFKSRARLLSITSPEYEIILSRVTDVDITDQFKICHKCYLFSQRKLKIDANTQIKLEPLEQDEFHEEFSIIEENIKNEVITSEYAMSEECENKKTETREKRRRSTTDESDSDYCPPRTSEAKPKIRHLENKSSMFLSVYKRLPENSKRCLFSNCTSNVTSSITKPLRQRILVDYKLYVPRRTQICQKHLESGDWSDLRNVSKELEFSVTHIENMLQLLETYSNKVIDFENIENMDAKLRHYWIGISLDKFMDILNNTPSLRQNLAHPKTALGMYLIKLRTGDAVERLSWLFNKSRRTTERLIRTVGDCIEKDYIPTKEKEIGDVLSANIE